MHRLWRLQAAKHNSLPEESKRSVLQGDEGIEELPFLADPEAAEEPMNLCQQEDVGGVENSAGENSAGENNPAPELSPLEAFDEFYMNAKLQGGDIAYLRPLPILPLCGASENSTCELCTTSTSTLYCTCTGRKVLMCERCIGSHCCKLPNLQHQVAHIIRQESQDLLIRCAQEGGSGNELYENVQRIDQCCAELSQTFDQLVAQLIRYRDRMIGELKLRRAELERESTEKWRLCGYLPNPTSQFTYAINSTAASAAIESLLSIKDLRIDAEYTEPAVGTVGKAVSVDPCESTAVIVGERHRVVSRELAELPLGGFAESAAEKVQGVDGKYREVKSEPRSY